MTVLLLQEDALQVRVWEKILSSQGMTVFHKFPQGDIHNLLSEWEENQIPLPSILLIELSQFSFNAIMFCQWCKQRYPTMYLGFLLIDESPTSWQLKRNLEDFRELSEEKLSPIDCFFPFPLDNLAITTLTTLKRLFSRFNPPVKIQNQSLASALISLNRELENQTATRAVNPSVSENPAVSSFPKGNTTLAIPNPPRKYRGQSY